MITEATLLQANADDRLVLQRGKEIIVSGLSRTQAPTTFEWLTKWFTPLNPVPTETTKEDKDGSE